MVPLTRPWVPFADEEDQLIHFRRWGLIPAKSKKLRPVMVTRSSLSIPEPCKVVGYEDDTWAVIELDGDFYGIHGEHLSESQPKACQSLPREMCFVQVLSDYIVISVNISGDPDEDCRIVEIGAIRYSYGKAIEEFRINVNEALSLADIQSDFLSFIGNTPLIGHAIHSVTLHALSNQFDIHFENPIIDTLPMAITAFDLLSCYELSYLADVLHLQITDTITATNELLWACLSPLRYEAFVHHEYLNNVFRPGSHSKKIPDYRISAKSRSAKPYVSNNFTPVKVTKSDLSDYVVFDIETTGFSKQNDRIIEIAAIRYIDGKPNSQFYSLVNPGKRIPANVVSLTGITQADVDDAPALDDIRSEFLSFIGDSPLVGHNVSNFDLPFLACQLCADFKNPVIDTLPMAREAFDQLNSHKLSYLNDALHLGSKGSHRAMNDVETTNALLWACMESPQYKESSRHKKPINSNFSSPNSASKYYSKISVSSIKPKCETINSECPLYQKSIVFTGTMSLNREDAMQMAVDAGAILKTAVSSKTDYLIVGKQDIEIVGMDGMSTKEEKAHALNAAGKANIKFLTEEEFLQLISQEEPAQ